jgi:hypothetical protein
MFKSSLLPLLPFVKNPVFDGPPPPASALKLRRGKSGLGDYFLGAVFLGLRFASTYAKASARQADPGYYSTGRWPLGIWLARNGLRIEG